MLSCNYGGSMLIMYMYFLLYSWHGVASMITKLSFSEADSVSSLFQGGQSLDNRGGRGRCLQVKLDCEDKVLLTQEQQVFEAQYTNRYGDSQRYINWVSYSLSLVMCDMLDYRVIMSLKLLMVHWVLLLMICHHLVFLMNQVMPH